MGLDQYAYVAARSGQRDEFFEDAQFDPEKREFVNPKATPPTELAYWRKHPNLQGWMEELWKAKGYPGGQEGEMFNCIELELTFDDIVALEEDIKAGNLPSTTGFFFGTESDEYYKQADLEFCHKARAELFLGLKVFYNSSW